MNMFVLQGSTGYPKRASTEKLLEIFNKYATVHKNGELYMSGSDFVRGFLKLLPHDNYNEQSLKLLAGIVDTSKDG
uniref:Uncharacterized protein n=1 Tax=Rhodnius prolixus TaxID=13249 RepID=T1I7Q7_RHOPR